jgi:hypothetical protein
MSVGGDGAVGRHASRTRDDGLGLDLC